MRNFLLIVFLLLGAALGRAVAQDRTISGRVVDRATNEGLPGVTVLVKGTQVGSATNADGTFSLSAPASATTLRISSVGFTSVDQPITDGPMTIALVTDTKQLNEVVVTALGVERTRNSLAYSATQVEGSDITVARNPSAINGLSGKVAGLAITQSNTLGGSSNVVIRGTKSLSKSNQALFVVDGVPISNDNTNTTDQLTGRSGYDYGNAAADINPDDIASTTVLKGAAATALYGERAANGVIIITTKKGRKGLGVTINTGVTVGRIDKNTFIKYQKKYGAGYGLYYGPDESSPFNTVNPDGTGGLVVPTSEDASYGARFDPNLNVFQWGSFTPGSPTFGKATPWVAADNDPSTFFKTGISTLNSIVVDGGNDNGTFKLGYTNNVERGVLPNSEISKNIVNLAASYNVTSRLTTSATVNFTRLVGLGRYGTGYGSENVMTNFRQWWETNVDIKDLKEAYDRNNTNATWNFAAPEKGNFSPIYWNNPYFVRYKNFENDSRYRTFGNVAATYKFADWFNVLGRVTMDSYDEQQEERSAVGSTAASYLPYYRRYDRNFREFNFDLIGNFNQKITENFSFTGLIGANMRRQFIKSLNASTLGGLVVPELYTLTNAQSGNNLEESDQRVGVDGIFASTTFGFRDRVFLDLTVRRDKSTTLPASNNSYVYPAASLGYVFSESLRETAPWLSYGKARINYAQVGSGALPYSVTDTYRKPQAFGSIPLFAVPGTKNNPDLKPELTRSGEIGIELAFLQNRLGVEANVYQQNTINQIIRVDVSTSSGYNSRFINSGEVRNKGVEISGYIVPIKTTDFNWRIGANWSRNENKVLSLFEGVDNIVVASYQGGISSNVKVGQAYGTLTGTDFVYKNGQRVVGANGYYLQSGSNETIADPNARWRAGLTNTISYKGLSLNVLFDARIGGQLFSLDRYYGLATGLQEETAGINDLGNESRSPVIRNPDGTYDSKSGGIILPGVLADGKPNTRRVSNTNFGLYGYRRNPNAAFVYDASFIKLREVALTYSLPTALTTRLGFVKGIDLSLIGRNLAILHKNLPDADPEDALSSGNFGQGYQSGAYPTTRTVGANVRFSF